MDYRITNTNISYDDYKASQKIPQGTQKLLGVSDELLAHYYSAALQLLKQHRWIDARDAFTFLTLLNPLVFDFWMGLGQACQSNAEFEPALIAYLYARMIDIENPKPLANSFQCSIALNNIDSARQFHQEALTACGDNESYADLKKQLESYQTLLEPNGGR